MAFDAVLLVHAGIYVCPVLSLWSLELRISHLLRSSTPDKDQHVMVENRALLTGWMMVKILS